MQPEFQNVRAISSQCLLEAGRVPKPGFEIVVVELSARHHVVMVILQLAMMLFASIGILIYGLTLTRLLIQVLRVPQHVIVPIIFPTMVAGSIFTFSLSLGDYLTAQIVGGKVIMLGNVVQQNYVTNLPFAAAFATIPVIIVLLYLAAVRRTGALDNL